LARADEAEAGKKGSEEGGVTLSAARTVGGAAHCSERLLAERRGMVGGSPPAASAASASRARHPAIPAGMTERTGRGVAG